MRKDCLQIRQRFIPIHYTANNILHCKVISMEKLDLTYIVYGMHSLMPIIGNTIVVNKTLNKIFYCVNDMLRCIAGGGTGFAHETYHIPAYTEYYIYKYQNMEANKQYQDNDISQTISNLWQIMATYNNEDMPFEILAYKMKYIYENVEYIKSLLTAEIYNYCLQEYMCRLINENVSEQEQLSL